MFLAVIGKKYLFYCLVIFKENIKIIAHAALEKDNCKMITFPAFTIYRDLFLNYRHFFQIPNKIIVI